MKLKDCHNYSDFRNLAKQRLHSPIFNYIDGAADDEVTYRRNTESFNDVYLIPNVLAGVENIDLSTTETFLNFDTSDPFLTTTEAKKA